MLQNVTKSFISRFQVPLRKVDKTKKEKSGNEWLVAVKLLIDLLLCGVELKRLWQPDEAYVACRGDWS